jgi:transposase
MHGPYPGELRLRVIEFVEGGGSRRGAAEQFEVSASSAIRWMRVSLKMGLANRCRAEGVLRPWRSIRGRSSPSSASNLTSRWTR